MKKKNILIAILCVSILLLVPLTNISGASIGGLNTKDDIVEEAKPVIPYYLFDELIELINQLLVECSHIPEIVNMCYEALEVIDSITQKELFEIICLELGSLFLLLGYGGVILAAVALDCWERGYPIDALEIGALAIACLFFVGIIYGIAKVLNCEWVDNWPPEINILLNEIGLNLQISPDSISDYDISAIQEFIQSYELNGCPCIYE